MGKGRNKYFIYVLFAVTLILIALSLSIIIKKSSEKPLQVVEYDIFFVVDEGKVGIDVNNTLLTFGKVMLGGGGKRFVVFDNKYGFPLEVKSFVSENLIGLIGTNSSFIVESGTNVTLPVNLVIPSDFELGNYTGKIRFEMYKAKE